MGDQLFYSTGQAATELKVTQAQIRALCESGAIETQVTPGGQWRLPKAEVDRLKADGIPPVPRPLPGADRRLSSASGNNGHPALYAAPSDQVIDAAEEVVVLENEVKALGLRRQKRRAARLVPAAGCRGRRAIGRAGGDGAAAARGSRSAAPPPTTG